MAKMMDLAGQRFGKLVAQSPVGKRVGGSIVWLCSCDCGRTRNVAVGNLRSLQVKSCGKSPCKNVGFVDLIGQRFGKWLVKFRAKDSKNGQTRWHCQCDCGTERDVVASTLKDDKSTGCGNTGACTKTPPPIFDLTGQRFGSLTVLSFVSRSKGAILWQCQCECGSVIEVTSQSLRTNKSTCGKKSCQGHQTKDLVGQVFGALKVRAFIGRINGMAVWSCLCGCGSIINASTNDLLVDGVTHCDADASCNVERHIEQPMPNYTTAIRKRYASYALKAYAAGMHFSLSEEGFVSFLLGDCVYCGEQSVNACNGIDRIDSDGGYDIENCVSCCKWCNWAKRDRSYDAFIKWLETITTFRQRNE